MKAKFPFLNTLQMLLENWHYILVTELMYEYVS